MKLEENEIKVNDSGVKSLRLAKIALDLVNSPILNAKVGDDVKALMDYNFETGKIVSIGRKNLKIHFGGYDYTVAKEKCATLDESVAVVFETWRGTNGRGGYRLERTMFPLERAPARDVGRQSCGDGRVTENSYGTLRIYNSSGLNLKNKPF